MVELFKEYWWLLWGVVGTVLVFRHNLRQAPEEHPETGEKRGIITRIFDPDGTRSQRAGDRLVLMSIAMLLVGVLIGLFKLYEWLAMK